VDKTQVLTTVYFGWEGRVEIEAQVRRPALRSK